MNKRRVIGLLNTAEKTKRKDEKGLTRRYGEKAMERQNVLIRNSIEKKNEIGESGRTFKRRVKVVSLRTE